MGFTIDSLIARGKQLKSHVANFQLGEARLGDVELPDPEGAVNVVAGRTRKRALEILQLAYALGAVELGKVHIDDQDGKSERPDFRVVSTLLGEFDVEVTQLRVSESAANAARARGLQTALIDAVRANPQLSEHYAHACVTFYPYALALDPRRRSETVAAAINELFRQAGMASNPKLALSGMIAVQELTEDLSQARGIFVSPPFPKDDDESSIDVARRVDEKRLSARGYMRANIPLWLVLGITADFGQLEISLDDAIASVCEFLPFQRLIIIDGTRVEIVPRRAIVIAQHDRLGRAWHESGHLVIGIRNGVPIIETTIERSAGSEMGFTEIEDGAIIDPAIDAMFTAAGGAAQLVSKFTRADVVAHVSQDDRFMLEDDIARRAGLKSFGERYEFAEDSIRQANQIVLNEQEAIDIIGLELYRKGTLSAEECAALIGE